VIGSVLTQNPDGHRSVKICRGSLARHITDHDGQAPVAIGKKIIKIAGKLPGRLVDSGEIQSMHFVRMLRQQLALNVASGVRIALQTQLVFARTCVKP
jgi:hypothetical protein